MMEKSYLSSLTEQKLKRRLYLRSLLKMQATEVFFCVLKAIEND